MPPTRRRLDGLKTFLGLGECATDENAQAIDPIVRRDFPGLEPHEIPPGVYRWLRAPLPDRIKLLGIYDDLDDDRKADLLECAEVIAIAE
jgi:hypothetical protein